MAKDSAYLLDFGHPHFLPSPIDGSEIKSGVSSGVRAEDS